MSPLRATQAGTRLTDSPFARLLAERPDTLRLLAAGDVVKGTILEIAPNSLYIDLGAQGVGIVFGRELMDASDTFRNAKIGDSVEATVLDPENDQGYVELSLRSASEEKSWAELITKRESGDIFPTQILEANKGGLIVRAAGITGFLPVSQLSAEHYPRVEGGDKQRILERLRQHVGQLFNVRVITADQREEKLIVSEKAAMTPAMETALGGLKEGAAIEGTVSGIVDFGVFVKFEVHGQELEGLAHISELAWQRVDDPKDFAKIGQKVKALVIAVDGTRISLSLKRLREDPWLTVAQKYAVGATVKGTVLKLTQFGAFVKLDDDIHGLAHVSELTEKEGMRPEDMVKVGEEKTFRIINIEPEEHRLGLSLKSDTRRVPSSSAEAGRADEKPKEKKPKTAKSEKPEKTSAKKKEK